MPGAHAYTPAIWPPLVVALLLSAIGLYAWRRRAVPGGKPFLAMSVVTVLILLSFAFEAAALPLETKLSWQQVQFVLLSASTVIVTCLVLDYAYPGRWLTRRTVAFLSMLSLAVLLLAVMSHSQLTWRPVAENVDGKLVSRFSSAGAILRVYGIGLWVIYAAVFLNVFIRSPQHRWPVALMLLGQASTRVAVMVDISRLTALDPIQSSVFIVILPWTAYAIALFGFRILDPLPSARRVALEQMRAGVVVLDADWRVASLNPAAERMLGVPERAARGKTWEQVRPPGAPALVLGPSPDPARGEVDLPLTALDPDPGERAETRWYAPTLSELRDFRGLLVGYLLMLHDVTAERRAQAQVLEQQRSLAMLREREQLARELHDGIGQVLGFASLKLAATRKLMADDKLVKANDQLARLESVVADAHADVREQILDLRTAPTGEKPFFAALQQYVDGYRQNYGMQVGVSVGAGVDDSILSPEAQVQLFRILQEAFSNARKHAQTDCVRVSFDLEGNLAPSGPVTGGTGLLTMRVVDDGQGFDPRLQTEADRSHFGLRFMRERAEQLHGSLHVHSAPGQGTSLEVTVPIRDGVGGGR
jgi:PAS domain S-box-containing protein